MNKGLAMMLLAVLALSAGDGARVVTLCTGFAPENNMKIPVGDVNALGIDEPSFNKVLDKIEAFYTPVFAAKGAKLVVNRKWTDATVNASAQQSGTTWMINMYGGLARHKAVTVDGFALVACHEIGHHIGGFPKISGRWATNEGGSDYFATLKCLRSILASDVATGVDPVAKEGCARLWPEGPNRVLCESGTMAGVSVSSLLAELGGSAQPSLTTTDPNVVDRTNDRHPAAQCRLDTYYQGALCVKPISEPLSDKEPVSGACTTSAGFALGYRPLCWYKPPTAIIDEKAIAERLGELRSAFSGRGI